MSALLSHLVRLLVENVFRISINSRLGESLHFFIYDSLKILLLLSFMIFAISYIRSFFPPEKTRQVLSKFGGFTAHLMASLLGIVTPFCSCSSVPLFIGFVEAGIPLGVTFSFLITSPIVNEVALVMLVGLFGLKIALVYVITGVLIGTFGGIIIGKLGLEKYVEEYVYQITTGQREEEKMTWKDRVQFAKANVKDIVKRVWLFILIGIAVGAIIHGYVPENFLTEYAGRGNPLAVFVAVALGIPLYSNAIGTIPVVEALIGKGVAIGTALAFMMAVTALSLPEMIILRKVIKPRLIGIFVSITGVSIVMVGYLFNFIL
ncbi:permease [Calderihabitans maritimus]|uniref:Permease n=1 Tax=Calderihabitans maritimus TaxID=1246530 RepID=A0A1Z5HT53_9FIRM|nr:permease [Calderihabitans maritimus]